MKSAAIAVPLEVVEVGRVGEGAVEVGNMTQKKSYTSASPVHMRERARAITPRIWRRSIAPSSALALSVALGVDTQCSSS